MENRLVYKERGALRAGKSPEFSSVIAYPSAKIEIYTDRLILKYPLGEIELKKQEIKQVEKSFFYDMLGSKNKEATFFDEFYHIFSGFLARIYKKSDFTRTLNTGIKITHNKPGAPRFIFFFSPHPDKIIAILRKAGYNAK